MKMNPSPQMGMMQFMLFVYPILIFVMSFQFPSALPLYWFYSNLYTIVQNYFLYRNNDKAAVVASVASATDGQKSNKSGNKGGKKSGSKGGKKGSKGAKKSR
jgi:YidC/Oxa1 family membrane protein insertase